MGRYDDYWPAYVSVSERKKNAAKCIVQLKKKGQKVNPVILETKIIANTFWGKSWCKHFESYSDYENRLPRGRTYVRNGSVIDLKIEKGTVNAIVSGSSIYKIEIKINALKKPHWQTIIKRCAGKIDSLIELLQGKFSLAVMEIMLDKEKGLFPKPNEMKVNCNCPDNARMCKHAAAVLYGIAARLDTEPAHLFLLRQVDHGDLIAAASATKKLTKTKRKKSNKLLSETDLASLFGVDIDS